MKNCPIDSDQLHGGTPCPRPGGAVRDVTVDAPQQFYFCSICKDCWTGVRLEAGESYQIRIVGDPTSWADGGWKAASATEAIGGWTSLSDIPGTAWWEILVKGPFVWWGGKSKRVPEAGWFQIFFAIRSETGTDTAPARLERLEQTFDSPVRGELYFFVNDHPDYYEKNNTGRMSLEISLVQN